MRSCARIVCAVLLLFVASELQAQTTILWTKDHVYAGAGGKEIAVITPPSSDTTAPSTPTSLTTSNVTVSQIQVNWTGSTFSADSTLSGFKLYRQIGSGASLPVATVSATTSGTSASYSYIDAPLQASTSVTYVVRAFDNAQNHSAASSSVSATTSAWTGETTAPSVPQNLHGWATAINATKLEWNASTDTGGSGIAGYKVYRNDTLITGLITSTGYNDTPVTPGATYTYKIIAVDNANNASAQSSAVQVTTPLQLLFYEDFNAIDQERGGGFWLQGGKAYCWGQQDDDSSCILMWWTGPNTPAGRIRASVTTYGGWAGIAFWENDNGRFQVETDGGYSGSAILLYNGTQIASGNVASNTPDKAKITVEADNTTGTIKVYIGPIGPTPTFTYTETDSNKRNGLHNAVGVGTYCGGTCDGGWGVDNFFVYILP